ncbi:GTP pyrophosphokinase [Rhodococcus triatomae]|nr:RelA/SpoT domain-containing protein [Rhodococcus triatomae BKS 15-14]
MSTHLPGAGTDPELVILGDLFRGLSGADLETPPDPPTLDSLRELQQRLVAFRLNYKFAIDATLTKINILREEFEQTHDYSPIEHVNTRLKSMESLVQKALRIGCPPDIDSIREQIRDIAGIRVTCAFVSDAYWVAEMLTSQPDVTLVQVKDYIANPKPNGYQSLHLIVQVPVYLSDRTESTYVEIQIRTIAMDFWASLEHKIYYKFDREVPPRLLDELKQAADAATELDRTMARLHDEVTALDRGATTLD